FAVLYVRYFGWGLRYFRSCLSCESNCLASSSVGIARSVRIVCHAPQFGSGQPHDVTRTGCFLSPLRFWIALVRCSLLIVSMIAPRRRNLPAIGTSLRPDNRPTFTGRGLPAFE